MTTLVAGLLGSAALLQHVAVPADSVDLETVRGRSILVHELVRYLQHAARGPAVTRADPALRRSGRGGRAGADGARPW